MSWKGVILSPSTIFSPKFWEVQLQPVQRFLDPYAQFATPYMEDFMRASDDAAKVLITRYNIPLDRALPVKFFNWRAGDLIAATAFMIAFAAVRLFLERVVFEAIGRRVCVPAKFRTKAVSIPAKYQDQVNKFVESCWKLLLYSFFSFISLVAVYREEYVYRSAALWEGCTTFPCTMDLDLKMRFVYQLEMSYYVFGIFALSFWEARRKDHFVMMAHHLVTLGLIGFSYWYGFLRVGVLIMLLHDLCDIPMELAKVIRYANPDSKSAVLNLASEIVFFSFFMTWIAARLVYFPVYVIYSVWFVACYTIHGYLHDGQCFPIKEAFAGLLASLFVMHLYWSTLIARIILRWFIHGDRHDVRED